MARFYRSAWFPYVLPFLIYLALRETQAYLPHWYSHLYLARLLICGGLLWMWRKHYTRDLATALSLTQWASAAASGLLAFAVWPATLHLNLIDLPPAQYAPHWPQPLVMALTVLCSAGFILISPLLNELFWRSFMLRYFITPDFRSIPLGSFQLFAFLAVIALAAFPLEYGLALCANALIFTTLLIWQKNLRCCIVAHALCNGLLAPYLIIQGYSLF